MLARAHAGGAYAGLFVFPAATGGPGRGALDGHSGEHAAFAVARGRTVSAQTQRGAGKGGSKAAGATL